VLAARDGPSVRPRGLLAAALLVVVAGALIVHSTSLGGVRPDPVAAAPPPPPPSLHKLDASGRSALLGAVRRDWIEGACAAAVQLCEKAARGGDPWVEALLADAHLEAGDVEGALAIVGSWTLGSDGDARALSVRAFIHQSRRDADARADAESALAKDEKLARGWVVRSWILMEQAGALGPEDAPPLWDKAREAAEHARRLAPPCRATAAIAFAHADLLIQRYGGKAEPFVEPEVILDPETLGKQFLPPPEWAGWAREKGEVALIFAGDARGATELNPYRSQAWVHLARSGDPAFFDEAMAHAERLDSWNPSVVQWRVRRHLADRRWDDALDLLAFQARRLPESAIELTRARILLAAGRPGEAVAVAGSAKPKSAQEQARIFVKAALIALRAHDLEAAKRSAGLAVEAAKIAKDIGSGIAAVVWSRVCLEAGDAAGARADDVSRAGGDRYGAARRAAAARGWLAEGRVAEAADAVGAALSASPRFRAACEAAGIDVGALGAGPDGERRRLLEAVLRLPEAPDSDLIAREWVHDWPCYGDMPPD
jgi:tetratricopeptide (TPR) repeat protein